MTLDELRQYCDGEFESIDKVVHELQALYSQEKQSYTVAEQASLATFIMNAYSGMENALKNMLLYDKLDIEDSPGWHEKVLKKSGEIGILPPELFQLLTKYLAFRNYFIYSYVFTIQWEEMRPLVEGMKDVVDQVRAEVNEYLQTI